MNIIKYISNININLLVLDILFLIISFLFFNKKKYNTKIKDLFVIGYTLINLLLFSYFNSIFQSIYTLKFLSVKLYLGIVIINSIIFLYTLNKKTRIFYKFINYLNISISFIILLVNLYIIISNKLHIYNIMDISNCITLMNIGMITFLIYLILISICYIGYYIYDYLKTKNNVKENTLKVSDNKMKIEDKKNNTVDDLMKYRVGENFYINGIDCSIIFCDSNKENIFKNYKILSSNINDKMVNGYTLNENIMIKNICEKLNVNNLGSIDVNNLSILNFISINEYNFLKNIFENLDS